MESSIRDSRDDLIEGMFFSGFPYTIPWPSKTARAFATVEGGADIVHGNQYYGPGPYNRLLYTLFPADSDFIVSPNYAPGNTDSGADFIVSSEIILKVKHPQHLSLKSTREAADR
ncbi:hypothetical protein J3R83DRAFT_4987 [Lanmaoa asiatica]|nr:hypothetical protein J3R83DRAFT_4987 [Lanmaoa asiatica]